MTDIPTDIVGSKPLTPLEEACDEAFAAWVSVLRAEDFNPKLRGNPYWEPLRWDAWSAFLSLWDVVCGGEFPDMTGPL